MSVIDEYVKSLEGAEQRTIAHMYAVVQEAVPDVTAELSYGLPSFRYRGKSLVAIMANKQFMSLYPFGAVQNLGVDLSDFECTSGSIHFTAEHSIPDDLLVAIVKARQQQIAASA